MSKEFIQKKQNAASINSAIRQEEQLAYFTISKLQDNQLSESYLRNWAERKYQTNDYFLNWIKMIFKSENFLIFFKYLRYPLPSSKVVKNKIEPQLKRVFNAEDADYKYDVSGAEVSDFIEDLDIKQFNKDLFYHLLYRHNSLLVEDLDDQIANMPSRFFVSIKSVSSIEIYKDKIRKIAFRGLLEQDGEIIDGVVYIDESKYEFYDKDLKLIAEADHDLGYAPVNFISPNKYDNDPIIRESLFTYVREELEEYNFLKTLQKMTEPNGALPVVSKLETESETPEGQRGDEHQPDSDNIMGSQKAEVYSTNDTTDGDLQPGTIHEIPQDAIRDEDGKVNMDVVKNFLNFYYLPVEILDYLEKRINEIEISIVSTIAGDFLESSEESKNELQIEKSISVLENTLTSLAEAINRIRKLSDTNMLSLRYGKERVNEVFIHTGTDFFLESQTKLFEDLEKAPNSLERKNIIIRINQNRYKNNSDQLSRQKLLYELMPFVSDKDFDKAMDSIDNILKAYQIRFTYWISSFEAFYGDIVTFYQDMGDTSKSEKLTVINNLIIELIKKQTTNEDSNPPQDS